VAFDGVVADRRRVARDKIIGDATFALECGQFFKAALFEADGKAVLAKVADPGISAGAARILDHVDARVCFGPNGRGGEADGPTHCSDHGASRYPHVFVPRS